MNERIEQLAVQAGFKNVVGVLDGKVELQKFAELIVQECMNVLDPGEHQLIARFQARKWLAEHFGVDT